MLVVSGTASEEDGAWDDAWSMATALSRDHDVILALPATSSHTHPDFAIIYYNQRNLGLVAKDSEAVVCDSSIVAANPFFISSGSIIPADAIRLRMGVLGGSDAALEQQEDPPEGYYIWVPPEEKPAGASAGYMKKIRYYMHKGGVRYTVRRALASLRRRLGSGG